MESYSWPCVYVFWLCMSWILYVWRRKNRRRRRRRLIQVDLRCWAVVPLFWCVCGQAYCCECPKWLLSQIHHVFDSRVSIIRYTQKCYKFFGCTQCTLRIYEQRTNTSIMLNKSAIGFELSSVLAITLLLCFLFDIYILVGYLVGHAMCVDAFHWNNIHSI